MQDAGYGLPRTPLLGTSVNKGKKGGAGLTSAWGLALHLGLGTCAPATGERTHARHAVACLRVKRLPAPLCRDELLGEGPPRPVHPRPHRAVPPPCGPPRGAPLQQIAVH